MKWTVGAMIASALVGSLTACSSLEQAASNAADSATCVAVEGIATQLSAVAEDASSGATAAELQQQLQALRITAEGVAATVGSIAPEATAALGQAAEAFDRAIEGVPTDATGAVADEVVAGASAAYQEAIDSVKASLGC